MEPTDIKRVFGKKIKNLRERDKLTQEKFAKKVGIDKQQISRYERGINEPRQETIDRIILYGNVDPEFFKITDHAPIWKIETTETKKLLDEARKILESPNEIAIEILKAAINGCSKMVNISKNENENKGGD